MIIQKDLPLVNALTGFSFNIKHLDGRMLHISSVPGEIIKHGDVREVPEEGMPVIGSPFTKGSLYIKFNVIFPTKLTPKQTQILLNSLPGNSTEPRPAGEVEEVRLEEVDIERMKRQSNRPANNAYDESSDEDEGRGGGVSCAQQ